MGRGRETMDIYDAYEKLLWITPIRERNSLRNCIRESIGFPSYLIPCDKVQPQADMIPHIQVEGKDR